MAQLINNIYAQRKYSLALFFSISVVVGLFTGFLTGAEFYMSLGLILGLYGASNVGQKIAENNK